MAAMSDVLIGVGVAIAIGVIMGEVIQQVLANANFTGLAATVASFLLPMFFIGLLILAVAWRR